MKRILRAAPIALAVAALFAAPLAQSQDGDVSASLVTSTTITNDIGVYGRLVVTADPYVSVETVAEAVVSTDQQLIGNINESDQVTNSATISGYALKGASGNIVINLVAGDNNAQTNDAAVAQVDDDAFASASSIADQTVRGNYTVYEAGTSNTAMLTDSALRNARGNIGLNLAAGTNNIQANALAVAFGGPNVAKAFTNTDQTAESNWSDSGGDGGTHLNSASIQGDALRGAAGNIGVNIAAGLNNLQRNSFAVAAFAFK
jgi:hypothetical protein